MKTLSEEIVSIASRYLGPEAKLFLERQATHLDGRVSFSDIQVQHLDKYSWWIGTSAKLIMKSEQAQELADRILRLKDQRPQ
jgi:hypothetical protein